MTDGDYQHISEFARKPMSTCAEKERSVFEEMGKRVGGNGEEVFQGGVGETDTKTRR